jgi:TRAP-type C4-dicarboxylate transport system permease small subunit
MAKSRGALVIILLLIGALFTLSGFVFMLQGEGIVGPNSSFMFKNPAWITDGIVILFVGLVLMGIGIAARQKHTEPAVAPAV